MMNMNSTGMPMMNHHTTPNTHDMSGHSPSGNNSNSHGGMGNSHVGMEMMMMQMYFVLGKEVTILFKQWKTNTAAELFGSCFVLFVLGVLYEGLKVYRQRMLLQPNKHHLNEKLTESSESNGSHTNQVLITNPARKQSGSSIKTCRLNRFSGRHLLQTFLHMLQVFIGYLLMLAFMTYNVWVCIAVILGAGFGYFLFGVQPVIISSDHCN
ncbi:high affinity copper uptake protein 1-like [Clytia hemisphaerica]|uniref:Copper transport protein n=1 Tax=Clytia hemisphaerica TaxID=252671 RepID=A0A7M5V4Y2_9CNID